MRDCLFKPLIETILPGLKIFMLYWRTEQNLCNLGMQHYSAYLARCVFPYSNKNEEGAFLIHRKTRHGLCFVRIVILLCPIQLSPIKLLGLQLLSVARVNISVFPTPF